MDTDYSKCFTIQNSKAFHAPFLPNNIFCIIAGSTGCGKTNLMLNFLLNDGVLNYSDVYIYAPSLHQPAYKYLKEYYTNAENKIQQVFKAHFKIGYFFDADEEIKDPKDLNPNTNHIMVFDDVMLSNQTKIKEYFCRGRHNNVNVFYLCQSLLKIAKHCIRDNANVYILFHQDDKTLKYFHETHISGDMNFTEFKSFCDKAWDKKHGFIVINLWEEPFCGRYIQNYETIYTPNKYLKILKNTIKILLNT